MDSELKLVGKVKDSDPEQFVGVSVNDGFSRITRLYGPMSEADIWAALHKQGVSDQELSEYLENARTSPFEWSRTP